MKPLRNYAESYEVEELIRRTHPDCVPTPGDTPPVWLGKLKRCIEDLQHQLAVATGIAPPALFDSAIVTAQSVIVAGRGPYVIPNTGVNEADGWLVPIDPAKAVKLGNLAPPAPEPCICVGPRARACRAHPEEP